MACKAFICESFKPAKPRLLFIPPFSSVKRERFKIISISIPRLTFSDTVDRYEIPEDCSNETTLKWLKEEGRLEEFFYAYFDKEEGRVFIRFGKRVFFISEESDAKVEELNNLILRIINFCEKYDLLYPANWNLSLHRFKTVDALLGFFTSQFQDLKSDLARENFRLQETGVKGGVLLDFGFYDFVFPADEEEKAMIRQLLERARVLFETREDEGLLRMLSHLPEQAPFNVIYVALREGLFTEPPPGIDLESQGELSDISEESDPSSSDSEAPDLGRLFHVERTQENWYLFRFGGKIFTCEFTKGGAGLLKELLEKVKERCKEDPEFSPKNLDEEIQSSDQVIQTIRAYVDSISK